VGVGYPELRPALSITPQRTWMGHKSSSMGHGASETTHNCLVDCKRICVEFWSWQHCLWLLTRVGTFSICFRRLLRFYLTWTSCGLQVCVGLVPWGTLEPSRVSVLPPSPPQSLEENVRNGWVNPGLGLKLNLNSSVTNWYDYFSICSSKTIVRCF
jgi:hypothetical protein